MSVLKAGYVWGLPRHVVEWKLNVPPPITIPGLLAFCRRVHLFGKLSNERLVQLCRGARQLKLAPGHRLCEEGDSATEIYVLVAGTVITSKESAGFSLTISNPADCFGESAVFAGEDSRVRGARATAGEQGATLLAWHVSAIEALVGFELQAASQLLFSRKMIESVRCANRLLVEGLSKAQIDEMLDQVMTEHAYPDKAIVVGEGDIDQAFYIVKGGEAQAVRGKGGRTHLATLTRGDCFGEAAYPCCDLTHD
uniref:Cyclic nucleotide-binding domain-containing protein n=1 Tax=Haptolina brevifila TaxID=156173 RepID=A0A7S2JF27_9EUKA